MSTFLALLGGASIIAGMVLLYLKVLPARLDGTFRSRLLQFVHDYFNFKKLYVESVLKFIFALATVACIVSAIVNFLDTTFSFLGGLVEAIDRSSRYLEYVLESALVGTLESVLMLVLGPVVLRLVYEFCMMFILLVKNVMEINNKTKAPAADDIPEPPVTE